MEAQFKSNHSIIVVSPSRVRNMKQTVAQRVNPLTTNDEKSSFFRAMGPILIMSQCFGLMPVNGIRGRDVTYIHFKWLSLKLMYSVIAILGALITTILYFIQFTTTGKQFADIGMYTNCVIHANNNVKSVCMYVCVFSKHNILPKFSYMRYTLYPFGSYLVQFERAVAQYGSSHAEVAISA